MSSEIVQYDPPNQGELLAEAQSSLDIAKEFVVNSPATYELAADELGVIKGHIKDLTEKRMSITRKMDEVKKSVMDLFRPALDRLDEAKSFYEKGMLTYNAEQERLRKAEQARLDALAKAERDRLETEARAAEEAAAQAIKEARGKAAKQAAEIAAAEAKEEAEALRMTAQVVVAPTATIAAPEAAGTGLRTTWKGRCTNKIALLKFIIERPEFIGLVDVNATALNQLAKSQKENMRVGGCEAYPETGITSRTK